MSKAHRWRCRIFGVLVVLVPSQLRTIFVDILFYFVGECIQIWIFLFLLSPSSFVVTPITRDEKNNLRYCKLFLRSVTSRTITLDNPTLQDTQLMQGVVLVFVHLKFPSPQKLKKVIFFRLFFPKASVWSIGWRKCELTMKTMMVK